MSESRKAGEPGYVDRVGQALLVAHAVLGAFVVTLTFWGSLILVLSRISQTGIASMLLSVPAFVYACLVLVIASADRRIYAATGVDPWSNLARIAVGRAEAWFRSHE